MNDDRFDRELGSRLRAYESRLPDTDPPVAAAPAWSQRWPLIGVGALAAVATVLTLTVLLAQPRNDIGNATSSPTPFESPAQPSASATGSSTEPQAVPSELPATRSPSPSAAPSPSAMSADLAWARTGSFPVEGGLSVVDDVAWLDGRYVAVGVAFVNELPVFGPLPPHRTRAWTSLDGRSWDSVELGPEFENVRFRRLIRRPDGTLLAWAERGIAGEFGISDTEAVAWTTTNGLSWDEISPPLEQVVDVEQGAKGMLAVVRPSSSSDVHEFWLSADDTSWDRVHSLEVDHVDIGAGDEGFAAVGWRDGDGGRPFAMASADGRAWIDGATPPFGRFLEITDHGPDWIVVDDPGGSAPTWFSKNGLDWDAHGEIPLRTLALDHDFECREYRSQLTTAGGWLVTTTELSYPCSESGHMVHGTQYLSLDGATWLPIPLTEGTPGDNRSGSSVSAALATDRGLILVGEENGAAAFWFGEAAP